MNHHPTHDQTAHPATEGPVRRSVTSYTTVGNTLTPTSRPVPERLIGIWAHPDDEAYLSAGLMARVVGSGGSVTVLTATRGEKGTDDPADYDRDHFAALREAELRASLAELGVHDVRFLGLRDGECDLVDDETVVSRMVDVIESVRPDAIVTFGPDGMTNHPDHRAISRWATEAWRRGGHGELLYATVTHDFVALHRVMHDRLGVYADFGGEGPASVSRSRIALECALDEAELDRKRRALAAHASQTTALASIMGEDTYRTWFRAERFRRPTRSEIEHCPVPVWMQKAERPAELVGAT
ncbi:MAG: PIG-L family deacetylase [Ilumatobacter sp.]|uniref:PIG-L deacetylase family protein n=1 Tax=Ilumatobacter sp. TaxID=1967498 RepID=UPI00262477AF|nr:PIG-L family deacetylase [Ilumatobacter sp.]MDJ0768511.1 PIG-L family deacetylase [Ilumatobacter sp.]